MVVVLALGELIARSLDYTQLAILPNQDSNIHNHVISLQMIERGQGRRAEGREGPVPRGHRLEWEESSGLFTEDAPDRRRVKWKIALASLGFHALPALSQHHKFLYLIAF